jgi:hypothetical protein
LARSQESTVACTKRTPKPYTSSTGGIASSTSSSTRRRVSFAPGTPRRSCWPSRHRRLAMARASITSASAAAMNT